jgi:hypothetical protein
MQVRSELRCEDVRVELSARLDREVDAATSARLDEHLRTCAECRAHEAALASVRNQVRIRMSDDEVPDLTDAVMSRIEESPRTLRHRWSARRHGARRELTWTRVRIAAVAAASVAVVFGASLPFSDSPSDIANADEIADEVRHAARALESYEASFTIIERGWHEDVGAREFHADVWFRAPENIHIVVNDDTDYPSREWPTNDYELIAGGSRWWIEERTACPTGELPACPRPYAFSGPIERRCVVHRQPFDGSTPLPTDIVVPLQTLASSSGVEVTGPDSILGRPAIRVRLDYRRAAPLVDALRVGGSWREFHPLDPVEIWLDQETWLPLRYEVRAGTAPDRNLWAVRRALTDRPGSLLLQVVAQNFALSPAIPDDVFDAPASGLVRDGSFRPAGSAGSAPVVIRDGLRPYRSGRAGMRTIRTYTDGLTYVKVITGPALGAEIAPEAEELRTLAGFVYYLPASESGPRRIDMLGSQRHMTIESNLDRAALLEMASSAAFQGRRAPQLVTSTRAATVERVAVTRMLERYGFAAAPRYLPAGYMEAAGLLSRSGGAVTVTAYYRHPEAEYEGTGIRIVQASRVSYLLPSSEEFVDVRIDGVVGRWSPERGELEWVDDNIYRAVAVPSGDLTTALRIANGLL